MTYRPPTVEVSAGAAPQLCDLLNQVRADSCAPGTANIQLPVGGLLDLVLAKGNR
jgi:hypothetical protein